jgi:hypothetical protein
VISYIADAEKARLKLEATQKYHIFPPKLEILTKRFYVISKMPIVIREDSIYAETLETKAGRRKRHKVAYGGYRKTWPIMLTACIKPPTTTRFTLNRSWLSPSEDQKELREYFRVGQRGPRTETLCHRNGCRTEAWNFQAAGLGLWKNRRLSDNRSLRPSDSPDCKISSWKSCRYPQAGTDGLTA